jgi:WD40 repeat protein
LVGLALESGEGSDGLGAPEEPASQSSAVHARVRYFGDYELLEEIARGGMGVVYRARQVSLNRLVALKMIAAGELATPSALQRFHTEAKAVARLDHPHIVPIYEVGEYQGQHYFSMKLIEGGTLAGGRLKAKGQGLKSGQEIARLVATVARAMHYAHQRGILHRDLKPTNILLDDQGEPHITDFGLAKVTEADSSLTMSAAILGTPAYMAPEQAAGGAKQLTTGADIYSVGAVLYELLTGQPPFRAETAVETLRQICEQEPIPPSQIVRRQGDHSKLDRDLETICLKCLHKDLQKRYGTAELLAQDLDRWLKGEPIYARPVGPVERVQRWCRRRPAMAGLLLALHVVFLSGLVGIVWEWRRAERNAGIADARQREASAAQARAEAAAMDLKLSLSTSYQLEGLSLLREDNWNGALAYLVRCITTNPTNSAALAALTTWLTYHSWPIPDLIIPDARGAELAEFGPDGRQIVIASRDGTVRVWDTQSGKWLTEPMKHTNSLTSARFSRDGKRIVTGSFDYTARVWDAQTGQPITPPMVHGGYVYGAQFDSDGRRVVTASADYTARVWDAKTGRPLVEPMKHSSYVSSAEFSPDGEFVLTASSDKTARVWSAGTGQLLATLTHDGPVHYAEFSPDGKRIVTASADRTARIWDTQTGEPVANPMVHGSVVQSARFSSDGLRIVTASGGLSPEYPSEEHAARVWDARTGQPLTDLMRHPRAVRFAQFSPDGRRILTGSLEGTTWGTTRIWNAQSGEPLTEPLMQVGTPRFSPDGKRVLTTSAAGAPCLWDVESGHALGRLMKHGAYVFSAEFSADGERILTASWDKTARVWDAQSGWAVGEPMRHGGYVWSAEFSRDGTKVGTASADKTAGVWDAKSGKPLLGPLQHGSEVISVRFSPDGLRLVTVSADSATWSGSPASNASGSLRNVTESAGNVARVWDVRTGKPLTGPMAHASKIVSALFSPDGNQVLTASWDHTTRLWDAGTGRRLLELVHGNEVLFAKFNGDGSQILTGCQDGPARLWDARTGRLVTSPFSHGIFPVRSAQWTRDGTRLLTASDDGTARVWDVRTGLRLGEVNHGYPMESAEFSFDDERILTTSLDGTARLWDARTGQPLAEPWKLGQHGQHVARFGPGDKRILTSGEHEARVWDMAPAHGPCPDWLLPLSEAISGLRLSPQGLLENTSLERAKTLKEIRRRLDREENNSDWVIWGRWLLADRATRTISPFSSITVPEFYGNQDQAKSP